MEVKKVNRKILLPVLVLAAVLLATPFVSTASARIVQTRQAFTLTEMGLNFGGTSTMIAPNIELTTGEGFAAYYIAVDVGTSPPIYPNAALYSASIDVIANIVTGAGFIHVTETIVFADGTLVINTFEHFTGLLPPYTSFSSNGVFVGYGTGALSGVKVQGTTSTYLSLTLGVVSTRVGTITGWV